MCPKAIVLILLLAIAGCDIGRSAAPEGDAATARRPTTPQAGTTVKPDATREQPKPAEAGSTRPPKMDGQSSVDMPLDIEIEVPDVPEEIRQPSAPLPEEGAAKDPQIK